MLEQQRRSIGAGDLMTTGRFFGSQDLSSQNLIASFRHRFRARDLMIHDGTAMRRLHLSSRIQAMTASAIALVIGGTVFSAAQIAFSAPGVVSAITVAVGNDGKLATMSTKVVAMQNELAAIRKAASDQARRLDARATVLEGVLTGTGNVMAALPAAATMSADTSRVVQSFAAVEARQHELAARLGKLNDERYQTAVATLQRVGLDPARFHQVRGASGGPFEAAPSVSTTIPSPVTTGRADPQFRSLFQSWKRLEQLQQGVVAIPSQRPVDSLTFTSGFGVRSDPFGRGAAMHAGVDIPGPVGTPIYATADGIVGRAERAGAYGNLLELDHGRGIQTRYGHLSAILVQPGARVARGQLIARMGSTGRSTGSHLHYEVRLDGNAVNPMPFLQSASYLVAMQNRARGTNIAMGGPKE